LRIHIIYIIPFSPKYEFSDEQRQQDLAIHKWWNNKGEFLGVWKEDGQIQRGLFLLQHYPEIIWEVWRPDYRADKVYEHSFDNGLIAKSFPETRINYWNGLIYTKGIYSDLMEEELNRFILKPQDEQFILILPAARNPFSFKLKNKFRGYLPIVDVHAVNNHILMGDIQIFRNPAKLVHKAAKALQTRSYMNKVEYLLCAHNKYINQITKKYKCKVYVIPHFEDMEFWKPDVTKGQARKTLNISADQKVIFASCRLVPEYQLDKVIRILALFKEKNFLLVISGYGDKNYKNLLLKTITETGMNYKVKFTGFIIGAELKDYYIASDVYISTCIQNSCPRSTNKALLLEIPVISTDSGFGAETLSQNNSGLLIPAKVDFNLWFSAFTSYFNGEDINVLSREIAVKIFNKEKIAERWMDIFKEATRNKNCY
jgi:glycosyltransferase involved in cell wall biosynthesis